MREIELFLLFKKNLCNPFTKYCLKQTLDSTPMTRSLLVNRSRELSLILLRTTISKHLIKTLFTFITNFA